MFARRARRDCRTRTGRTRTGVTWQGPAPGLLGAADPGGDPHRGDPHRGYLARGDPGADPGGSPYRVTAPTPLESGTSRSDQVNDKFVAAVCATTRTCPKYVRRHGST